MLACKPSYALHGLAQIAKSVRASHTMGVCFMPVPTADFRRKCFQAALWVIAHPVIDTITRRQASDQCPRSSPKTFLARAGYRLHQWRLSHLSVNFESFCVIPSTKKHPHAHTQHTHIPVVWTTLALRHPSGSSLSCSSFLLQLSSWPSSLASSLKASVTTLRLGEPRCAHDGRTLGLA